jgi:cytochrome b561
MNRTRTRDFSLTAKWFHWLLAFLLYSLATEAFGFKWRPPEDRGAAVAVHVSLGVVILGLTLVRLSVRAADPPPSAPRGTPDWMTAGAKFGHAALYGVLIGMGVLGVWMAALSPVDIRLFSGFNVSALAPADPALLAILREVHFFGAIAFVALLIGHVSAALWHHFRLRDDVLIRMLPFGGLARRVQDKGAPEPWRFPSANRVDWKRPEGWFVDNSRG